MRSRLIERLSRLIIFHYIDINVREKNEKMKRKFEFKVFCQQINCQLLYRES